MAAEGPGSRDTTRIPIHQRPPSIEAPQARPGRQRLRLWRLAEVASDGSFADNRTTRKSTRRSLDGSSNLILRLIRLIAKLGIVRWQAMLVAERSRHDGAVAIVGSRRHANRGDKSPLESASLRRHAAGREASRRSPPKEGSGVATRGWQSTDRELSRPSKPSGRLSSSSRIQLRMDAEKRVSRSEV
jgi:hypothetical protein